MANKLFLCVSSSSVYGKDFRQPCYEMESSNFDEMIDLAKRLWKVFPFVRVDLYNDEVKIYFGKMIFYLSRGYVVFSPDI